MADMVPTCERSERDCDLIDRARQEAVLAQASAMPSTASPVTDPMAFDALPDSFAGYQVVRTIHSGGQGVVVQAIQKSTRRKVAIKVMRAALGNLADRVRFEREVQILSALDHPSIVAVHDSGISGGRCFYVMDYISGEPLDRYISSGNRSRRELIGLFIQICEAVNFAHLRGVIHRDLKPANIRIDSSGKPHVLDFGLAKLATGDVTDASQPQVMSMTGQFIGSMPWAAPEQAEGVPGKIDVRTDVYALGVVLYQMLTGRFPYNVVGNPGAVLEQILHAEPVRPSTIVRQIDDELETIILKSLAKERERRYQTAGELARDLHRYLAGEPIEAKRDSVGYLLRKQFHRYKKHTAIGASFVMLLVAGVIASLSMWRQAAREREAAYLAGVEADHARISEAEQRFRVEAHRVRAEGVTRFLHESLAATCRAHGTGDVSIADVLDGATALLAGGVLQDAPDVEAAAHIHLAGSSSAIGRCDLAERHLAAALDILRRLLGNQHPEVVSVIRELELVRGSYGDSR